MAKVVELRPGRPRWLFFVAGRLMVASNMPLAALHAQARRLGIPRRCYRPSPAVPFYSLPGRSVMRCVRFLGPMPCQPEILEAAMRLANRSTRPKEALEQ
jgi:hypothetical protein